MFKNYLLVAFRNLTKNKGFSFINIFGLGLSMSLGMMVLISAGDLITLYLGLRITTEHGPVTEPLYDEKLLAQNTARIRALPAAPSRGSRARRRDR